MKMVPVIIQDCLSQAGTGGDQRFISCLAHDPFVQREKFIVLKREDTIGCGFKVVEKVDGSRALPSGAILLR